MTQVHKDVHIIDNKGHVDKKEVDVYKTGGEEVIWFAQNQEDGATIEFSSADGSPFYDSVFHVPIGGSVSTGPAKPSAVDKKYYKYTVKGPAGQYDPGVIIHN